MESVNVQEGIDRKEVKKAIDKLKCGKASSVNGITTTMLKYGGETLVGWMLHR